MSSETEDPELLALRLAFEAARQARESEVAATRTIIGRVWTLVAVVIASMSLVISASPHIPTILSTWDKIVVAMPLILATFSLVCSILMYTLSNRIRGTTGFSEELIRSCLGGGSGQARVHDSKTVYQRALRLLEPADIQLRQRIRTLSYWANSLALLSILAIVSVIFLALS